MFKKVLIANRGEIACRITRTLQHMGIRVVAVYSEADEEALHVKMADEAYLIGSAPVYESYLNSQSIIKVALQCGAEAIHPGYGFLSENADFAQAVQDEKLFFIGPSPNVIKLMGDKLCAKKLAGRANIPCLPGIEKSLKDLIEAEKVAREIGYPLMMKAVAGGGGKGMRIVNDPSGLAEALKGAMSESQASFGDERIFIEKYIDSARHIEIQVLADHYGNVIHLGERECSLQRRHQKVIEEAPSSSISPALRQKMGDEAVRLAKAVEYSSAGTVEFVVDQSENFYFLEMNTRLQVEHPTTEMITGINIVEEMVRIAAGEPLRFRQEDIRFSGHAIEARIYAEDSSRGFLPSIGRIVSYLPPLQKEGELRLDSGIQEGDSITSFYDPLIAKLIVRQPNRNLARDALLSGLDGFYIRGIETNISFLESLIESSFFHQGGFNTTTLDILYNEGFTPQVPEHPQVAVATAAMMYCIQHHFNRAEMTILVGRGAHPVKVALENGRAEVKIGHETLVVETPWKPGDILFSGVFNGHAMTLQLDLEGIKNTLSWDGHKATTCVVNSHVADLMVYMPIKQKPDTSRNIIAPMPGLIIEVSVCEGEFVKAGQSLMIIEAMKMENVIRASRDGSIEKVYVQKGDRVNLDQHLATME
ncbi:MAG: acetyl-CoA carboxylase biotin carboxylase subunit [Proteobacteria bacterium]|nr:acetyl-CoA carboxylase biotin carboxylase subunit [Pseudomonadota bacterium]